jgi:hypothetical protein
MGYLLDEFGLPNGLGRLFYNAEILMWWLRTVSQTREGTAVYARGDKPSFRAMSMVQIVEYHYNVAFSLRTSHAREWLVSQGVVIINPFPWRKAKR